MSKYTIELRSLLEHSNIDLGMKNYPLYNFKNINQNIEDFGIDLKGNKITNYRDYLNNKIFTHFYFREIGFETPQRFVFVLNRRMSEILPFYNQMYESADCKFNPLWNVEMHETYTHTVEDKGNSNSKNVGNETIKGTNTGNEESKREEDMQQDSSNNGSSNSTKTPNLINDSVEANMDTAQTGMNIEAIKGHDFISSAKHDYNTTTGTDKEEVSNSDKGKITNDNTIKTTNDTTNTMNQTNNNTLDSEINNTNNRSESYSRLTEGSSAGLPYSDAIKQWRNIMVNIDMMICDELENLFMQIF